MKLLKGLLMMVFCGLVISSCFEPPEYPNKPEIVFKSVQYVDVPDLPSGETKTDSVVLVLKFKDGDGNLGLSAQETAPPFNDRWYYVREPLRLDPTFSDDCSAYAQEHKCWYLNPFRTEFDKYVDINDFQKGTAPFDTLKSFSKPYNCTNWEVVRDINDVVIDTLYFTLNPHYNNIYVEFQIKNGDNTYTPFDWSSFLTYPSCEVQGFNGRFPILTDNPDDPSPLEGEIKYAMPSPFFKIIFGAKTVRLRVSIEDRALNRSNEIFTPDFNFQ